jgi:hypothetical protein
MLKTKEMTAAEACKPKELHELAALVEPPKDEEA